MPHWHHMAQQQPLNNLKKKTDLSDIEKANKFRKQQTQLLSLFMRKMKVQQLQNSFICPEILKHFSCSTQLSMKFILLINVLIVLVIFTLINRLNSKSEKVKEKSLLFIILTFSRTVEISCSVYLSMKKFYNLGTRPISNCKGCEYFIEVR